MIKYAIPSVVYQKDGIGLGCLEINRDPTKENWNFQVVKMIKFIYKCSWLPLFSDILVAQHETHNNKNWKN